MAGARERSKRLLVSANVWRSADLVRCQGRRFASLFCLCNGLASPDGRDRDRLDGFALFGLLFFASRLVAHAHKRAAVMFSRALILVIHFV